MNLKSQKTEKSVAELIVEVSAEEFDAAINEAFKKGRNHISVPGFRKGKAPRKIIERMYGESIFYNDALDVVLPGVISFVAEKAEELKLASAPRVTDIDVKDGGAGVDVTVSAAVQPEVKLGEYKGLSAVKMPVEVSELEIDTELEGVRLRNARIETVTRPAGIGDIAVINFEGFVDGVAFEGGKGENHELLLGSGTFIPGFEEQVQGMSAGEERDIDVTFPGNYSQPLAGKPAVFKIKVNEVKEKIQPELDDEFAKDVSEFDTLEEYKADIKAKIQQSRQENSDIAFENALMEKIIESMEADIPEMIIEDAMEKLQENIARQVAAYGMNLESYLQMMGMTPEAFIGNIRTTSEKQVKTGMALEKIAELENIEISDEEIENEYNEASERFGGDAREQLDRDLVVHEIRMRRAAKIVTDSATAEDPPPPAQDKPSEASEAPKKPAAKKPAAKKPAAEKAETSTAAAKKPAAKKPAAAKPAAEKSASEKSAAKKPAAKKPAAEKAETSTAKKPAAKKPAEDTKKKADKE